MFRALQNNPFPGFRTGETYTLYKSLTQPGLSNWDHSKQVAFSGFPALRRKETTVFAFQNSGVFELGILKASGYLF